MRGSAGDERTVDAGASSRDASPLKVRWGQSLASPGTPCNSCDRDCCPRSIHYQQLTPPRARGCVYLQVRQTQHVSYQRCEEAGSTSSDEGDNAAAAALAIVERSMRNNPHYKHSRKSTVNEEQRAAKHSNVRYAAGITACKTYLHRPPLTRY